MVLCFKKPLSVVGLGPLLPSAFSVLKIKMGQKKWRVSRLIIKSEDLISFKSILWETATHQCQLCLLLESIIFLKSYLILWKCNLYNIKCKQTFPENHDLQKRDYHFRMEVVHIKAIRTKMIGQLVAQKLIHPIECDTEFQFIKFTFKNYLLRVFGPILFLESKIDHEGVFPAP